MAAEKPDIQAIFNEAVARDSDEQCSQYLDEVCGDDPQVRERVEALLRAHSEAGGFFGGQPAATEVQPITEKPGTVIGPYKLLQQIGEGGMGVVYMAEQKEPVKRRVALKIIKPGMDTRQVIARFEAERQALAMMDHPNIAKVLDAGATDSGRPYFVMELVNGISVTQYCDEQHLTPKERLELFVPICEAVQHAHQKGIIHRDLKPSNVMIALYDDRAVPKVIDFGVAKATSQTLTEKTMFTQLGQIVGTLEYMSPEQAQRNQMDIDTRSDIYSLGVLLYELLTGDTPFDRQRLHSAAFDEMLRIIREEEPVKPSTKVSGSASLAAIAANRKIEPAKLSLLVRGELDWIVMKALEKDRGRRYSTATSFAEDIRHYLNDEAVVACPPSAAYRFRKFARRNKAPLLTALLVMVALLLGIAGTTWQAIQATQALHRAVNAESVARTEADRANREFERANREAGNAKIGKSTAEAERLRAESNLTLAMDALNDLYLQAIGRDRLLGDRDRDEPRKELSSTEKALIEAGLDFYKKIAGQNEKSTAATFETATAFLQIGLLHGSLDDHEAADTALLEAIARLEKLTESNPNNADYFKQLGRAYYAKGNLSRWWPQARDSFVNAEQALCKAIELDSKDADLYSLRGQAYQRMSENMRAADDYARALDLEPNSAKRHHSFAIFQRHRPDDPRAIGSQEYHAKKAVELAPQNAYYRARLGYFYWTELKDRQLALEQLDKAIELDENLAFAYNARSAVLMGSGDPDQALKCAEQAIQLEPKHWWHYRRRAEALRALGRDEAALAEYNRVEQMFPNDEVLWWSRGDLYLKRGDHEAALREYDKALELRPKYSILYKRRATSLFHLGRFDEALVALHKALDLNPNDTSALCWIPPTKVARCPDENFRQGLLKLADEMVRLHDSSSGTLDARANILASFGNFEQAIAELEAVIAGEEATYYQHYQVALLALAIDDPAKYRAACQRMLETFSETAEVRELVFTAWTCVLLPDSLTDYSAAIGLAKRATQKDPQSLLAHRALAGLLLRAGDYESALDTIQQAKALEEVDGTSAAYTDYLLAMVHHRLGDSASAQAALKPANAAAELELAEASWNRRLTLEALRNQAESLIYEPNTVKGEEGDTQKTEN